MGYFSNEIIECTDKFGEDMDTEKVGLILSIQNAHAEPEYGNKLRKFLSTVLPAAKGDYWLFAKSNEKTKINLKYKRNEYIDALVYNTNTKVDLFLMMPSFSGWRKDKHARTVKAIYIDIDDVGYDISTWEQEYFVQFIKDEYNIPDNMLPNYVVKSGHGMHLYYVLTNEIDAITRKKYFDYINTRFRADIACRSISHPVRVPFSWNCKREPRKSSLFEIHNSQFTLNQLDFFQIEDEIIQKHIDTENSIKKAKRQATREKNKAAKESQEIIISEPPKKQKQEEKQPPLRNDYPKRGDEQSQVRKEKPQKIETEEEPPKIYYQNNFYPHQRYFNILRDLNNYAARRNGRLQGKRDIFAHITAALCRKAMMSQTECFTYCEKYFTQSFIPELQQIVTDVYNHKNYNMYRLQTIATMLQFTERDYAESYCCFSKQRQKEKKQAHNKKYYATISKNKKQETAERIEIIKENPELTTDDIVALYDVSIRTAQRLKEKAIG
jgi:hypothetical protein